MQVVREIGKAYNVTLAARFVDYPNSAATVAAVINGTADVTDPFTRQWTVVGAFPREVRVRVCVGGGDFPTGPKHSERTHSRSTRHQGVDRRAVAVQPGADQPRPRTGVPAAQTQRSFLATPACTIWATFLSISWNATRFPAWKTVEDLANAGSQVRQTVLRLPACMLRAIARSANARRTTATCKSQQSHS